MLNRRPRPVEEHEARGDTARIYHEIRQSLRITGINLNFRTWAAFPTFLPIMWSAMQPVAASGEFESASDYLRARAADLALSVPALGVSAALGPSQQFQLARALALYHYINPKLLLFTVLVGRGLTAKRPGSKDSQTTHTRSTIPLGPPPSMAAMEMVDERPDDPRLRRVFNDIRRTLQLSVINSDYRTLGLWPDYLEAAWTRLKPVVKTDGYRQSAESLANDARIAADQFPTPAGLDLGRLAAQGEKTKTLIDVTDHFERLLPSLILNMALLARDLWPEDRLRRSPFPSTGSEQGA